MVYIVIVLERNRTSACPCSTYLNNERQYYDSQSYLPQRNSPFSDGSFYKGVPYYSQGQLEPYEKPELPRNMNMVYSTYGYPYIPQEVPTSQAVYTNRY